MTAPAHMTTARGCVAVSFYEDDGELTGTATLSSLAERVTVQVWDVQYHATNTNKKRKTRSETVINDFIGIEGTITNVDRTAPRMTISDGQKADISAFLSAQPPAVVEAHAASAWYEVPGPGLGIYHMHNIWLNVDVARDDASCVPLVVPTCTDMEPGSVV